MDNNTGSAREQFEQEAEALKGIIYEFIHGGHIIMAAQLLEQYTLLNPNDPDLDEIRDILYHGGAEIEDDEIPEEYGILKNIETIFILSGIITKRTGYIDSVLRKIKLMEEKWNYKPALLTCIHNIDQRKTQTWLSTAGVEQTALDASTKVINVYEYFQKSYVDGLENKAIFEDGENDSDILSNDTSSGTEIKKYYTGYMGSLRMVRYFNNGNADKDMVYDDWGYLNYIREYSPLSEDIYDIKYFTTDGRLCIEKLVRLTDDGTQLEKIILYNDSGEIAAELGDDAELATVCLEQIMSDDMFYMLIVEDGLMSKAAAMIDENRKNVAKCIVVHSIFLNNAYDPQSGPQKYYKYLCENHDRFDGILMLTEEARRDFNELYGGGSEKIFVIPHPYPYQVNEAHFDERDNLKAVIVSRLDPLKQVNYAVEIFAKVAEALPDARLEIYGRGPEEERIRALIKRLGMEINIFLKGHTDNPLAVFSTAALSIGTSSAEGFGLSVMESICNGCPAFAFDIKYGPAEIIDDGKTGFLFNRLDAETFARMIYEYFNDIDMQRTMSENCYAAAHRFSNEKFLENWYKMTETIYRRLLN